MEETLYDTEVEEQQQPDPIPKPKKLKVKDFAAKIKAKYPDYKNVDDLELTNKIISKYPEYKEQVELTPEVKKKVGSIGLDESSLQAGNSLSTGVGSEEIPTVEMYTTPGGETVETDPISLSKKYNELKGAVKPVSDIEMGMSRGTATPSPDEEKRKEADKLQEDFKDYDLGGIYEETKDLNDEILAGHGKRLMQERKENPQLYQRDMANLKWRSGFERQLLDEVDKGNIDPDNYNRIKHSIDTLPEFTGQGDYSNQRLSIQSLSKDIQLYGGENKEQLLKDFAVEVSKVYGNAYNNKFSETVKDTPESKYFNENAQLGYQYIQDVSPDKAEQYKRLLIDPKTLKDKSDEQKGYNHLMQTLEETGIGLQQNSVSEELNNLKAIAERNNGLTPEQIQKATDLEKKQDELSQKREELDKKYPDRITNKVADAVNEIMGHDLNWGEYAMVKTGQAFKNTGEGIWEMVSSPFMSDASNNLRELAIMGENITSETNLKQPDKNKSLLYDKFIIEPDLQKQADEIKSDKGLNDEQKRSKLFSLFYNNRDKFGRVPIQNGKFNINPSSILYGVTDLATGLLPFVGIEMATGGIGGAGAAAKFIRTFTAAAATTFHDEYAGALMEGKTQTDAYKSAMASTAINSMAMAGAATPTAIKEMASGMKTSASKIIAQMSEAEIQKVLAKGTPKGLKAFGQSLKERGKAIPSMVGQGLKTGAKFEAYMTGANILNDREVNFKQALINTANFGILGGALGQAGFKNPTELQKSHGLEFGKNPDEYIEVAKEMKKNGQLNESELTHRIDLIERYGEAYKTLPKANDNGKPLTERQKAEYLYNSVIKNEGNKAKSNLPPNQAKKAEHTALVADFKNGILLEEPTDKQLETRQSRLEKILEPKTDAEGKAIELPEKQEKEAKAELQAVKEVIEESKSSKIADERAKELMQPKGEPENISQPIELSIEPKEKINEEVKIEIPKPQEEGSIATPELSEVTLEIKEGETGYEKGITHAAVAELRKIVELPEYEGKPKETHEQLIAEAQETVRNNPKAINEVLEKMEKEGEVSNKDNAIAAVYKATIDAAIEKSPTPQLLSEARRLAKALDVSGTKLGKALESRKLIAPEDNLTNFLLDKEAKQGTALTEIQLKNEAAKYEELKAVKEALEVELEKERERYKKDIAELGINKARAKAKREAKKSNEDYKVERKNIIEAAKQKIIEARNAAKVVSTKGISSRTKIDDLVTISPHIKDYVNSLLSEGIDKLDNIITAVHAEFKDILDGLTKPDVLSILSGEFDTPVKKQTRNEKANEARLLQREAALLKELERERLGLTKEKTEKKITASNRRIDELKEKIKEVRKLNKNREKDIDTPEDATAGEIEYNKKLQQELLNKARKLTTDIRDKNYLKEKEAPPPFKKSRKTQLLEDRVIDLENKIRHERSQDEYNKRGKWRKGFDKVMEVLGIRRVVQSAVDISVPFRQGATMLSPRKIDVWLKGFKANLQSVFSPKKFERIMNAIRKDPQYHEMEKDGIRYNDMNSADPLLHNEDFRKSFVYKIPIVSEPLKASARSADAFLNVTRYEMYKKMRRNLEKKGYTRESDPIAFKKMANWVMNMTGSGKKHKIFDSRDMNTVLGNTFYGANLMASRFNLLNPLTYFDPRIPKEVRYEAMKDMAAFTTTMVTTATALAYFTGAKISLNPDDADFLQLRYGNKVYDISGGLANYVRTGLRIAKAGYTKATGTKYEGNKATENAGMSGLNFIRNKLSPNTAYGVDLFFGKNYGQDFDPKEIAEIYPMYTEDFLKAMKEEGGLLATSTVLLPNILGIGYGSYASKGQIDATLEDLLERNLRSDEMNNEKIKNYNEGGRPVTFREFNEFADKRDAIIEKNIKILYEKGVGKTPYKDLTPEQVVSEIKYIKAKATSIVKEAMFGQQEKTREEMEQEIETDISRDENYNFEQ